MDINITAVIKKTSQTITGSLKGVCSAKTPQDITVEPSSEVQTIKPDNGCYIRSVTVKAIKQDDNKQEVVNDESN